MLTYAGGVYNFFVPYDEEVSADYVHWVCAKAKMKNLRVDVTEKELRDDQGVPQTVQIVHVYKFSKSRKR